MRTLRLVAIAAVLPMPATAYAQNYQDNSTQNTNPTGTNTSPTGTMGGAVGGAAVGAVVGGPIGAVVGAGLGSIMGSQLPQRPSEAYNGPIAVGDELPRHVATYPVPHHRQYRYAIVNHERVIVDQRTRRIERVIP